MMARVEIVDWFHINVVYARRDRGLIFCHVRMRRVMVHLILLTTGGSHIWNGEAPILIKILTKSGIENILLRGLSEYRNIAVSIRRDLIVCIRKYFVAALNS